MLSEIRNTDPLERIVRQAFHDLADKYDVDVDIVASIIVEYDEIMMRQLEKKIVVSEN